MFRNSNIAELVHDISFAVFRISALIEHPILRKELEMSAVELSSYVDENSIYKLTRLINLGNSLEEISNINAEVLKRELSNLKELLVAEYMEEVAEEDISGMFNKENQELPFKKERINGNTHKVSQEPSKRQTEILDFIRQFNGNCRMSDIAERFDGVSKRTLRNDISALIEGGNIERVGNRGPYSYLKTTDRREGGESLQKEDTPIILGGKSESVLLYPPAGGPQTSVFDTSE